MLISPGTVIFWLVLIAVVLVIWGKFQYDLKVFYKKENDLHVTTIKSLQEELNKTQRELRDVDGLRRTSNQALVNERITHKVQQGVKEYSEQSESTPSFAKTSTDKPLKVEHNVSPKKSKSRISESSVKVLEELAKEVCHG